MAEFRSALSDEGRTRDRSTSHPSPYMASATAGYRLFIVSLCELSAELSDYCQLSAKLLCNLPRSV